MNRRAVRAARHHSQQRNHRERCHGRHAVPHLQRKTQKPAGGSASPCQPGARLRRSRPEADESAPSHCPAGEDAPHSLLNSMNASCPATCWCRCLRCVCFPCAFKFELWFTARSTAAAHSVIAWHQVRAAKQLPRPQDKERNQLLQGSETSCWGEG